MGWRVRPTPGAEGTALRVLSDNQQQLAATDVGLPAIRRSIGQ
jgi:hypothetical protein